ncbi:MAG: type VI secretion system-associated FHA domain protein TagH [Gammaproteobacteria bacterium]|nr:type VI secretion system-associated FHA domain protein TagH [Gammaproteobacteria bacterium]
MELILEITSGPRETMGSDSRKVFDTSGGTIGRALKNDWVLPDPDRIISSYHAKILYKEGAFYLQDTSMNGVFYYDDGEHRVGKGNEIKLSEGVQFSIKDYVIEVEPVKQGEMQQSENSDLPPYDLFEDIQVHDQESSAFELTLAGEAGPEFPEKEQGAQPDHAAALEDYIKPPKTKAEEIPENWYMTGIVNAQKAGVQRCEEAQDSAMDREHIELEPTQHKEQHLNYPIREQDLLRALFRGMELNEATQPLVPPEEFMELVGKIFRECIQGLMQILMARASIKNEFRISMTTIQPMENNPLKFAMDVDDALQYLLIKRGAGFLPPRQAVNDAIRDLEEHQIATLAGMREAFVTLITRFGPKALEEEFDRALRLTFSKALNRRTRYWKSYVCYYRELTQDTDMSFQSLFGEAFVRAYEEQVERLRASRMNPTDNK